MNIVAAATETKYLFDFLPLCYSGKYAYVGGFDATSNVLAGKLTGIDVKGTHAHAYIMCYSSLSELHQKTIGVSLQYEIVYSAWFDILLTCSIASTGCSANPYIDKRFL